MAPIPTAGQYDETRAYRLDPDVAVRPEGFGALAYHYGTRRLSLLQGAHILHLLDTLERFDSAGAALDALNLPDRTRVSYAGALARLAETGFIRVA